VTDDNTLRDRLAAAQALIAASSPGTFGTPSEESVVAAGQRKKSLKDDPEAEDLTPEEIQAIKLEKISRKNDLKVPDKGKYTPQTQPRDAQGKFRLVLARLKSDLGNAGLERVMEKVEEAENLDHAGDYSAAVDASRNLLETIDRLDSGALDATSIANVRASSAELGKVISNLPFAFGEQAQKIRFSDVPPTLRDLMKQMIARVEDKIGAKDAAVATRGLKSFMSGSDVMSQSDISSQMATLLRLLT
jgi:hypothetical protein